MPTVGVAQPRARVVEALKQRARGIDESRVAKVSSRVLRASIDVVLDLKVVGRARAPTSVDAGRYVVDRDVVDAGCLVVLDGRRALPSKMAAESMAACSQKTIPWNTSPSMRAATCVSAMRPSIFAMYLPNYV